MATNSRRWRYGAEPAARHCFAPESFYRPCIAGRWPGSGAKAGSSESSLIDRNCHWSWLSGLTVVALVADVGAVCQRHSCKVLPSVAVLPSARADRAAPRRRN